MKPFVHSIKQHQRIILQIAFGLIFVALGIFFIKNEIGELSGVREALVHAKPIWLLWGLLLLVVFTIVQGMMYQQSFRAINEQIRLTTGINLYLKRNLVSVFLPAGVVTNMLFFNESVERKDGVSKTQIYYASSLFSISSILSGIIIGLPALVWLLLKQHASNQMIIGVLLVIILLGVLTFMIISILRKGRVFYFLEKRFPGFIHVMNEVRQQAFNRKRLWLLLGLSILIEIIGISHLYIAVKALGGEPTLAMAVIGYAIVLLLLMSSPFLRGIGAVEAALTYSLTLFGLSAVLALSVAILFRFFEFWAVLGLGIVAMVAKKDNVVLRTFPALLLFLLGLINIISGITPAVPGRLASLSRIIPLEAIDASTWLVILAGIIMLATSIYLVRGLKNAWITALVLSGVSLIAHLTKGIDWEEATVAMITFGSLIYQRRQYFIKTDLSLAKRSIFPGLVMVSSVILFATIAFWLLHPHHFNMDFNLWDSFKESVNTFFLLNSDLHPSTAFGRQLILGLNLLGGATMVYCVFLLFRPLIIIPTTRDVEEMIRAAKLVEKLGNSSLDYFKTYADKKFWFSQDDEAFVAFKTSDNYAIALENPVCRDDTALAKNIQAFDEYCRQNGLRSAYYRIPEVKKAHYEKTGKKLIPIGEVAVLNIETWTLAGGSKAGLRNEANKLKKLGYTFNVNTPPQKDAFLQQLKAVSDSWLKETDREELVFSQGMFSETELKKQTVLSVENPEGKVVGFVNLIPDYVPYEANFDLMRKTEDAPNGTMDFLFVKMFEYLKSEGFKACNMGMVPLSGIDDPENLQERVLKLAYERMRRFGHYKSLWAYKEKFDPDWHMMYLAYDAPIDLIYLPAALEKVFEPGRSR